MDAVDIGRALVMILFSGVNLALCWFNYLDLDSPTYRYGLVVGPPTPTMLMGLFIFTVVASVVCGVEVLNAISVPFSGGKPRLPLEIEQCLALAAGSVPLAAINLSIVVCRMRNHTPLQIACCVFLVLNLLVRMIYAFTFEQEYKSCGGGFKMCAQVMVFILGLIVLVLAGLIWGRVNASFKTVPSAGTNWLRGVSIMLLQAPELEGRTVTEMDLTHLVRGHNLPKNKPWLVKDLIDVAEARESGEDGVWTVYSCRASSPELLRPEECEDVDELKFHFRFNDDWQWSHGRPLGVISFNYAQVSRIGGLELCLQANQTLTGAWRLFYLAVKLQPRTNWTVAVLVTSPWKDACTMPYPLYDPSIPVCSS